MALRLNLFFNVTHDPQFWKRNNVKNKLTSKVNKLHRGIYENMKLSHILLVVTYCRTFNTSGCLFIYLFRVWPIHLEWQENWRLLIGKNGEFAKVPPEGPLYRQLLYASFMIQDSRSVGCHRNGILPKNVSTTTFDVTSVKAQHTLVVCSNVYVTVDETNKARRTNGQTNESSNLTQMPQSKKWLRRYE
jgi:hypothetical protein